MVDGKELECAAVETKAGTLMRFAVSNEFLETMVDLQGW